MLKDWQLTPYNRITVKPVGSVRCGKKPPICNELICLDTETSHNHNEENPIGWIYQWCFSFQNQLIYGRKPSQFIEALEFIKQKLDISEKKKLCIFIHNASYDLEYLKDFLIEKYGNDYKILAISEHKFITFEIGNIIFKCSYRLTNKSLAKFSKDMNAKHKKLVGAIDYDEIRFQDSKLTRNNWRYMFYDVVSMHESLIELMKTDKDNLATIPLTSTGYVRRDGRNASRTQKNWHSKFNATALTLEQYLACKQAFSGAITHGNRFFSDTTVYGRICHYDFRSHYPSQLRCKKFPIGKFNLFGENLRVEQILPYLDTYSFLIRFSFTNAILKDKKITCPYMQTSKIKPWKTPGTRIIEDNGRTLAVYGSSKLWLGELDLELLFEQYNFESYCLEIVYCSVKDYLPKWFCDFVDKYYFEKSDYKYKLKEAEKSGRLEEMLEADLNLMKSKNRLNGIYGMTATDIIRSILAMDENGEWSASMPEDMEGALNKFYKSRNNFLPYQWGFVTTQLARYELLELIKIVSYENFLYADTDSIFFIDNDGEAEKRVEAWNKEKEEEAINNGWFIESQGKKVIYHQFEKEDYAIKFRFLHAKCYAYVKPNNELKCVIAGVRERKGKYTREKELGSIDRLTQGTVFYKMGGTKAVYVESKPYIYEGMEVGSACIITPTTKTLNNCIEGQLEFYEMGEE